MQLTGFLSLLSYISQDIYLPGDGTTHRGLRYPISISNQELIPQTYPQASLMEPGPQLKFLLPSASKSGSGGQTLTSVWGLIGIYTDLPKTANTGISRPLQQCEEVRRALGPCAPK